jgi:hypothetical protein
VDVPRPVNVPDEATYWTTQVDGAGRPLSGRRSFVMHFPAGRLPPTDAFWSLTMGDARNRFVPNPIRRYSVSDWSGMETNADGSLDVHIQHTAPAAHESNWLPAPPDPFTLWLRVYLPGRVILEGRYAVPPSPRRRDPGHDAQASAHLRRAMIIAWFLALFFWPRLLLSVFKRAILVKGFGEGPIPVNSLYVESQTSFADPLRAAAGSPLATTGVNRDTLRAAGWLDLRNGPHLLHVPDAADRYYSVQLTDPHTNTNFAYVGPRTTGTRAGDYLITGPRWTGQVPSGTTHIPSPHNAVLIIVRVLVYADSDLPTPHDLARHIQLTLPPDPSNDADTTP